MISDTELMDALKESIVDTLAVETDEVTPQARLFADLGAESIDILDLSYRLEKRLGVKVQLEKALSDLEWKADPAGQATPESVEKIRARFPTLAADDDKPMAGLDDMRELLTVDAIFGFLKQKLGEIPGTPT